MVSEKSSVYILFMALFLTARNSQQKSYPLFVLRSGTCIQNLQGKTASQDSQDTKTKHPMRGAPAAPTPPYVMLVKLPGLRVASNWEPFRAG